ncbi:hypothetical protein DFH11DRAFT_1522171, partial [Phellopilus nigrolimitatus]
RRPFRHRIYLISTAPSPPIPQRFPPPEPAPAPAPWNAPQHALPLEAFSWPSMWFDVPSVSPPAAAPTLAGIFAPQYDLLDALPELDHSKTPPDSSPASLHDACTTPPQDCSGGRSSSSANVVATCDVPLVAPRPLPFASPTFLQFDSLPDEDEDLSFPPYTHSRRVPASARGAQNPRKRPAPPLPPPPPPSSDADSALLPSISKKQRRARAEPAVFVDGGGGGGGARHRVPQLVRFGHDGAMGWI